MCRLVMAVAVLCSMVTITSAQDAAEPMIYVIEGTNNKITEKDVARIDASGIAGSTVVAEIKGPAKLKKSRIVRLKDGQPLIGANEVEFLINPTGKGDVTVTVTVKNPTSPTPIVTTYGLKIQ